MEVCEAAGCFWEFPTEYQISMLDAAHMSVAKALCKGLAYQDTMDSSAICATYMCLESKNCTSSTPPMSTLVESSGYSFKLQSSIRCKQCIDCSQGRTDQVQQLVEVRNLQNKLILILRSEMQIYSCSTSNAASRLWSWRVNMQSENDCVLMPLSAALRIIILADAHRCLPRVWKPP